MGRSQRGHHGRYHHELRIEEYPPDPGVSVLRPDHDKPYDLHQEQQALAERCPKCGFQFPVMPETSDSTAVFKDVEVPKLAPMVGAGD